MSYIVLFNKSFFNKFMEHTPENIVNIRVINSGILVLPAKFDTEQQNKRLATPDVNTRNGISIGWVVKTGPGYPPIQKYPDSETETWKGNDDSLDIDYVPIDVKENDKVFYNNNSISKIQIGGVEYHHIFYHQVLVLERNQDS